MIYPNYVKQSPVLGLTSGAAGGASLSYFTHTVDAAPPGGGDDSGAVSFDGDNDYLSITGAGDLAFGTGDFTVECWAYFTGADTNGVDTLIDNRSNNTDGFLFGRFQTSGHENRIEFFTNAGYRVTADVTVSNNTWVHAAAVRHNGTTRVYINGVAQSTTYSDSMNYSNDDVVIGSQAFGSHRFQGLISNFRMVKGTAVYTSNFNPSSTPLTAVTNTKLLCCQSKTSVTDAAVIPAIPGTIVNNGGATVSTSNPFSAGSVFLDGTNDYIIVADNADLDLGNSDFTIEAFIKPTGSQGSGFNNLFTKGWELQGYYKSDGAFTLYSSTSSSSYDIISGQGLSAGSISLNTWQHLAICRSGNTWKIFVDGVQGYSATHSGTIGANASGFAIGDFSPNAGQYEFQGYISNFRVIKGTALYTSNFTVPTEKLTDVTNTKLLCCQTAGPVTAAAVTPSIITTNGDPQPSTSTPFVAIDGGGSLYLDGSSVVKITSDSAAASIFNIGSSTAFTVEAWVYVTSFGSYNNIMSGWDSSCNYQGILLHVLNNGQIFFGGPGSGATTHSSNASSPVTLNKWHHVAVTRNNGSSGKFYIDGVSAGTFSNSGAMNNHGCGVFIGANMDGAADGSGGSYRPTGYISNLRYVVGHETYTTSFTPPTEPLTTTSQGVPTGACKFLACQDETSIDTNSISVPMTADYGTPIASGKNPFSAVSPGGAAETSGSVSFDGNGDYLSIADSNDFNLGSGDFTIEAYVYANTFGTWDGIIGQWPQNSGNVANSWVLELVGGSLQFYYVVGSTYYGPINGGSLSTGTWHHVAAVRSGNTMYMFKDGMLYGNSGQSVTHTFNNPTSDVTIGGNIASGGYLNGKISNLRLVKGTALFTSNFTPPSSPLTAVTNTKLLCCQSAGSTTDAAVTPGTITANGNVVASTSNPLLNSSVYFNNSSLRLASTADLCPGTSDFTFECWLRPNNWGSSWETVYHNGVVNGLFIGKDDSGNFVVRASNNTSFITQSTLPSVNQWTHIAVTRQGSTLRLFYDGILKNSVSNSHNFPTAAIAIGQTTSGGEGIVGRISNLRFIKGTAIYTSNFTVPTSPLTAVTNTKLICCQSRTSATAAVVSPGTISNIGGATVSTSNPF